MIPKLNSEDGITNQIRNCPIALLRITQGHACENKKKYIYRLEKNHFPFLTCSMMKLSSISSVL